MIKSKNLLCFLMLIFFLIGSSLASATSKPAKNSKITNEIKVEAADDIWPPSFDELLDPRWPDLLDLKLTRNFPRMNIQESDDAYHIEAEMPGIKKDEIEIKLKDNFLVISGEKKSIHEETKKQYRRIERASGEFYRAISLPGDIDKDKVTARLEDGILKIDFAKTKNHPKSVEKKIIIK